jgi:uncharacterized protein
MVDFSILVFRLGCNGVSSVTSKAYLSYSPNSSELRVPSGNSWLSIAQVNFASRLSHPALKALAPWEAFTNVYDDFIMRGGRPHIPRFHSMLSGGFAGTKESSVQQVLDAKSDKAMLGPGSAEDIAAMAPSHPLYDDYWEAKRIPTENIDNIPLYLLASYS